MSKDYSKGRYNVYAGRGPAGALVGRIDNDEFVRDDKGQLLLRIDGDEVYQVSGGGYVGEIVDDMIVSSSNSCLYVIRPE